MGFRSKPPWLGRLGRRGTAGHSFVKILSRDPPLEFRFCMVVVMICQRTHLSNGCDAT